MSNFGFLRADWPELHAEACRAEEPALGDPRAACFYARRTLEHAVKWLYDFDTDLTTPYKDDLNGRLQESPFSELAPSGPDIIFPERWSQLQVALEDVRTKATAAS